MDKVGSGDGFVLLRAVDDGGMFERVEFVDEGVLDKIFNVLAFLVLLISK